MLQLQWKQRQWCPAVYDIDGRPRGPSYLRSCSAHIPFVPEEFLSRHHTTENTSRYSIKRFSNYEWSECGCTSSLFTICPHCLVKYPWVSLTGLFSRVLFVDQNNHVALYCQKLQSRLALSLVRSS